MLLAICAENVRTPVLPRIIVAVAVTSHVPAASDRLVTVVHVVVDKLTLLLIKEDDVDSETSRVRFADKSPPPVKPVPALIVVVVDATPAAARVLLRQTSVVLSHDSRSCSACVPMRTSESSSNS